MATPLASLPGDTPIIVRDRRRKPFFMLDNELVDRFAELLKPHGLAVYVILARFANQDGACWPSLATIAKRTGMSRRQVIREIDKLQDLGLIAVDVQIDPKTKEHKTNIYTLLDIPGSDSQSLGGSDSQSLGGSDSQSPGGDSQTPKQHTEKKTHHRNKTQRTAIAKIANNTNIGGHADSSSVVVASPSLAHESIAVNPQPDTESEELPATSSVKEDPIPPVPSDPPSPLDEAKAAAEQALIAVGISHRVAHRLASHYSAERITDKIAYLHYLQDALPESVKHPTGWLRRAIEQDYQAQDGYISAEEQAAERYTNQLSLIMEDQRQWHAAAQEQHELEEAARLAQLHTTYGTTQREVDLWNELLTQFKLSLPPATFSGYVEDTLLLSLQDGKALIGLPNRYARDWVENRLTRKIERSLSICLGGQPVAVTFIDLATTTS